MATKTKKKTTGAARLRRHRPAPVSAEPVAEPVGAPLCDCGGALVPGARPGRANCTSCGRECRTILPA